ncbi:transcription factor myb98 [Quercus suber]|uniref:Transcription factor myb98 n=1 Tax=Quercus suber TaxID=58331 RepID=A0AAW0LC23_QUESU|nr:transcription factor myb98 [Quercus suber]
MELDTMFRENPASQPILLSDNYLKSYMKDDFSFEAPSSKGFLQDFHYLDQFQTNGSLSNPIFGVQTQCYGCTSSDFDIYECKPFMDNGGHGHVMENFQGGGYLNHPQRNPIDIMGSDRSHMVVTTCQDIIKPLNFVVPDEVSCITAENGYYKKIGMNKNRALPTTKKPQKGRKKSNVVKGQWTVEEDRLLIQLVKQYGVKKWSYIAQMLPGRIGKQCRERWHNHLRPDIKKDTWSEEEDKVLIQAHAEIGNKWAEIAKRLPGRTENSIKNHWNATKRRQYSKRKCRSKYPRGSLLQEYIKGLNLDPSNMMQNRRKTSSSNATANNTTIKTPTQLPQSTDQFCPNARLVPNYDFNEVPDFYFDENMFQESCSIDSLLDDIPNNAPIMVENINFDDQMPCGPVVDENMLHCAPVVVDKNDFDMDIPVDMTPVVDCDVKKELDLVEMMSQLQK